MKYMLLRNVSLWVVMLLTLSGCINQKKATTWLNNHEQKAAEYCAVKFPIKETIDSSYLVDSAAYNQAYYELWAYADSLLRERERVSTDTVYFQTIRDQIKTEIKWKLKPCVDSIKTIVKTVENTAKIQALVLSINAKDDTISKRDARITVIEGSLGFYKKWFYILCGLIVLFILYSCRKLLGIRIPFLN